MAQAQSDTSSKPNLKLWITGIVADKNTSWQHGYKLTSVCLYTHYTVEMVYSHGSNISTECLETLFWTSRFISDWWHWCLGLGIIRLIYYPAN